VRFMELAKYFELTKKREHKTKPRNTPLPKAKQNYLEAFETLKEELQDLAIGFESKFQPIHTTWSGGRGGKLSNKAWSLGRYDQVEDLGFKIERLHPDSVLSGYAIDWIKGLLERVENESDPTISSDRID